MEKTYSTQEAADRLGLTDGRIRQLLIAGQIKGIKMGRDWRIPEKDMPASWPPKKVKV